MKNSQDYMLKEKELKEVQGVGIWVWNEITQE